MPEFKVHSEFEMMGDQPQAVEKIAESIESGNRFQTLLGVTGSGKIGRASCRERVYVLV